MGAGPSVQARRSRFNCAAPFRERLWWWPSSTRLQCYGYDVWQRGQDMVMVVAVQHPLAIDQASIVPPPFGSGYAGATRGKLAGLSCFNCAAPFRERLSSIAGSPISPAFTLQLCRPLSGAVMRII